jgi:preprotein translocase subunit SecE
MENADKLKYVVTALLVLAGLAVYRFVTYQMPIWQYVPVIVGLVLAVGVFLVSAAGRQFVGYAGDSVKEAKKVVWPSRKEAMQMTAVVFGFVAILAIFLWAVDSAVAWLFYDVILKRGG